MKLISMTDFVLQVVQTPNVNEAICWEQTEARLQKIYQYSLFLKQPLKLEMFVPCDEDGDVLEEPIESIGGVELYAETYQKAKKKVLFDGFKLIGVRHVRSGEIVIGLGYKNGIHQTIEDLVMYHKYKYLILTESAIKQLGL
jgi:hypothetical protein